MLTLHKRHICFIYSVLHLANYYLSYEYQISNEDWYTDVSFLLEKIKLWSISLITQTISNIIKELCEIHDGITFCPGLNYVLLLYV